MTHNGLYLGLSCQPQLTILQFALSVILALEKVVIELFASEITGFGLYLTVPLKIGIIA